MNNYGTFGSSPETEEHLPKKIANQALGELESMVTGAWDQLLGVKGHSDNEGSDNTIDQAKTLQTDAALNSVRDEIAKQPQALEKQVAEKGGHNIIGEVIFQLTGHNSEKDKSVETETNFRRKYVEGLNSIEDKARQDEERALGKKIQAITDELKRLIATTKLLQVEFGSVTVEPPPQKPGKYHENFFEWLLLMVKQAREKVENSGSWLRTIQGKGKEKGYWGKAKKHGTTFTQSSERSLSTSSG